MARSFRKNVDRQSYAKLVNVLPERFGILGSGETWRRVRNQASYPLEDGPELRGTLLHAPGQAEPLGAQERDQRLSFVVATTKVPFIKTSLEPGNSSCVE
ncbi:hypothetical protein MTO96_024961 [Rhipicephalus appendiculatus]